MQSKFLIGADPELFLNDAAGALVSVIDKIGGTKAYPLPLPLGDGYAVQEDNVACEFNIAPAASEDELANNIQQARNFLEDHFRTNFGLTFSPLSAAEFPADQLEDPRAQEFGCDPDYNAWTGQANPKPKASSAALRSAGGHVHVGVAGVDDHQKRQLIKLMDLFLGVPSIIMDKGELRKQLYGKAGACRYKPYGAEYRTLSNFWVLNPELCKWVYRNTGRAVDALQSSAFVDEERDVILDAINNNNREAALHLIGKYSLEVVHV